MKPERNWTSAELLELLPGLLEAGGTLPLVISGSSMSPFLIHGRDTVYLSKICQPVKPGDMVLYRRYNGELLLHRIRRTDARGITLLGDAQTHEESGVKQEQLLAMVTAVNRNGKLLTEKSLVWKFFAKIWLRVIPLRRKLIACYAWITRKRR